MLQAATSENKNRSDTGRPQLEFERERELQPQSGDLRASPSLAGSGGGLPPNPPPSQQHHSIAGFQSVYGNQAVLRMLRHSAPAIQTKLAINRPGDAFEQEADHVADQVMRMTAPAGAAESSLRQPAHSLQRACSCGGSGGECSKCKDEKEGKLQRAASEAAAPDHAPSAVHEVLNSPGRPLDPTVRAFMEPRFGYDFSHVRIHQDARAASSARAVNALAYAVGQNIVFAEGQYSPATSQGRKLLAHELTHVVQQEATAPIMRPAAQRQTLSHAQQGTLQRQSSGGDESGGSTGAEPEPPVQCPPAPTGLGDKPPESPCFRATFAGTTELARWLFCLDSDQIKTATQLDDELDKIVEAQPRSTRFLIHGHASTEGRADYNFRLACHRANKIFKALAAALRRNLIAQAVVDEDRIQAEIQSRIEVGTRGATTEFGAALPANRVVVLYGQIPGADADQEPACKDAPRHLGDIKPEINCDTPTVDLTGMDGSLHLRHFHFCLDSDVLAAVQPSDIAQFAQAQAASATFVVHGFASTEGAPDYNKRLSCHRALRIARELMNAGVRPEQIREVSGLGEINKFGDLEFNRVVIVLAEGGEISPVEEPTEPAKDRAQKLAIRDAAVTRILAGQYPLAADAYVSFWTCGRTPTVAKAVERLNIEVPDNDTDERFADQANGIEEGIGVNAVQLSNTALHADNPVECTMGRLIDMAFHHAVIGDDDLSKDLLIDSPKRPKDARGHPARVTTPRHLAGLHLIALAGLSACTGKNASAQQTQFGAVGIDEPLSSDPRAGIAPPDCARPPQPTRLLPPSKGEKERQRPDFAIFEKSFKLNDGKLTGVNVKTLEGGGAQVVQTAGDVVQASASVLLVGTTPDVFADYEVGFMQTVLDDFLLAEYITGHHVLQKLPVPIRAAQMKGDVPVPQPWMALTAMALPDAQGQASINTTWRMDTQFALSLNFFRPELFRPRLDVLDTWQRHTSLAFWLVARRRGAPLDRFSVLFIDGFVYDLTQNLNFDFPGRQKGDLRKSMTDPEGLGERELVAFVGEFHTTKTSEDQADPRLAQFDVPVASDIDLKRQTTRIIEPEAAPEAGDPLRGMGLLEYARTIQKILDNLVVFSGGQATVMPRLGFVFAPLEIHVNLDRRTGRIPPTFGGPETESDVSVKSNELGERALFHLALALALRLSKRDFLQEGKSVVLNRQALDGLPGNKDVAQFVLSLSPLKDEPDLSQDSSVLKEWAEMWACSEQTIHSPNFLHPKEFAKAYWMDRDGKTLQDVKRLPEQGFFTSSFASDEKIVTFIECPLTESPTRKTQGNRAGFAVGTAHTHPADAPDQALPSPGDKEMAKAGDCGRQHYIISENRIVAYFSNGSQKDLGDRKSNLPQGVPCNQFIPPEVE